MTTGVWRRGRGALLVAGLVLTTVACSEDRADPDEMTTPAGGDLDACTDGDLLECARATSIADLVPDSPEVASGRALRDRDDQPGEHPGRLLPRAQRGGAGRRRLRQRGARRRRRPPDRARGLQHRVLPGGVHRLRAAVRRRPACRSCSAASTCSATASTRSRDNGIPYVGGIPVSTQSVTSPNSFQWSGGTLGRGRRLRRLRRRRAGGRAGRDRLRRVRVDRRRRRVRPSGPWRAAGVERCSSCPFPILATDLTSAAPGGRRRRSRRHVRPGRRHRVQGRPSTASRRVGLDGTDVLRRRLRGARRSSRRPGRRRPTAPSSTSRARSTATTPIPTPSSTPRSSRSTATASTRSAPAPCRSGRFMNLYVVLRELGADDITPGAITEALEAQVDAPSFMGHPYTCDGEQFAGLPAMCSPQQVLAADAGRRAHPAGRLDRRRRDLRRRLTRRAADQRLPGLPAGRPRRRRGHRLARPRPGAHRTARRASSTSPTPPWACTSPSPTSSSATTGDLVLPLLGLPDRVHLLGTPDAGDARWSSRSCWRSLLGLVVYWLVFRPLRQAPPLAQVVASLGLLLYLQEIVRLRFPVAGAGVRSRASRSCPTDPVRILGTTVTAEPAAPGRLRRRGDGRPRPPCSASPASGWPPGPPPATRRARCSTGHLARPARRRQLGGRLGARRLRGDPHRAHRRARPDHHQPARRAGPRRRAARRARVVRAHRRRRPRRSACSSR